MTTTESLKKLFPQEAEIPAAYKLGEPVHQRRYLLDGQLKVWNGKVKPVLSPVCITLPTGEVQQLEIGSYPVMGEAESDAALDAAIAAYDSGRGKWPTMLVAQRIERRRGRCRASAARQEGIGCGTQGRKRGCCAGTGS